MKPGLRALIKAASKIGELPLSNRDRVKAKLRWHKTKWGKKDDW